MSEGTCWPPSSISTREQTAHGIAHRARRGQAHATANATSTVRIVWPLGYDESKLARWTPWA